LRKQYAVSSEAVLHRLLRLTTKVCFAFVARKEPDSPNGRYKVDYAVSSRNWNAPVGNGFVLPPGTILSDCTAIGFTAKADESWFEAGSEWKIEALGIPAYPGRLYPRVIGIVRRPDGREGADTTITYLRGDATAPRGSDYRILAQIVNDRGIVWGAGFGRAVRKKWPAVQDQFAKWAVSARADFCLGNMHFCRVDDSLVVANLVAQHGFGPSRTPRIRYGALEACLQKLAGHAASKGASVHMPRIGTGEAGGSWDIVSEIIEETLCQRGIDVMVYDLPTPLGPQVAKQSYLSFHRAH